MRTVLSWVITGRVLVISYRRFGTTHRSHLYPCPLKMGPIAFPEKSVRNDHYSMHNNTEEHSCQGCKLVEGHFPQNNCWCPLTALREHTILTYLLTYFLTHTLTYSLTHSFTHTLTNSFTYSLTYSLTYLLTYVITYLLTYSTVQSPS